MKGKTPPTRSKSAVLSVTSSVASVALETEIDECQQRLLSGEILLSAAAHNSSDSFNVSSRGIAVKPFPEALKAERNRLEGVLSNRRQSIEFSAEALLKDADGLSCRKEYGKLSGSSLARECNSLGKQAEDLQTKTLKIIKEAINNRNELLRIANKADVRLKTVTVDVCERDFSKERWKDTETIGHIVKLLSDIFSLIRKITEDANGKDNKWVAPTSFERVTTKYWSREENIPEVLLKSAAELPILVYGKSGLLTKNLKNPSESKVEFWKSMASPISSVYFDSENLDLYRRRLKRAEGAQLVRVRWYGKKPKKDSVVFLELKTHHECWIENKSVKKRVNVLQYRMSGLIDTSDGPWTPEFAKELVLEGTPEATEDEIIGLVDLLLEIRKLFCKLELKPCVRTSYIRAAFQSPTNNNLRLTIDRDITVIDEFSAYRDRVESSSWCIEDIDVVPIKSFIKVPYGVFEVKVSGGENPLFVEELIRSNAIVEAPKFSKFLTGVSFHNAKKVKTLPWWAEDALFAPVFKKLNIHRRSSLGVNSVRNSSKQRGDPPPPATGAILMQSKDVLDAEEEVDQFQDKKKDLFPFSFTSGLRSRVSRIKDSINKGPETASRSPARVEPKSFFANERTFIQWITVGTLFTTIAGIVYASASANDNDWNTYQVGNGLVACALFVAIYGTIVYYRRLYLMTYAKPYGYADAFGPAVLAIFMIILLCAFIYVEYPNISTSTPKSKFAELPGVCIRRNLDLGPTSGISALQFEPSGIVVDKERNLIIVASLNEIVAINADLPNSTDPIPIKILYRFPDGNEDLEGLEIIKGTIYAVSENKGSATGGVDQSDIIEFHWTSDGLLNETLRWRVNAPNAEGITYFDDKNWFPVPTTLIAADLRAINRANRLELKSIDFPFPRDNELPTKRVNNKLFVQGLKDSKVADMQFFDGLLYVLYNKERLIRAYNQLGNKVFDWLLPVAVESYGDFWEGMRLEKVGSEVYLHLALDSPPQLWTIKLETGNLKGGPHQFPKCARSE